MEHSTFRIERVIRKTADGPIIRVGQHPQVFGSLESAKETADCWASMTEQEDLNDEHFEFIECKPDGTRQVVAGLYRMKFDSESEA